MKMLRKITVISPECETNLNIPDGTVLARALSQNGFTVPAACGGKGTCGKCSVKLISGSFDGEAPKNGMIRSCKAVVTEDASINLDFHKGSGLTDFGSPAKLKNGVCGIAVDIGTTTVAASLLKKDGSVISGSRLNPQSVYGADVISRIEACSEGNTDKLTGLIRGCVKELTDELNTDKEAEEIVISGNTTMLHIFCGISPESMGVYPFTPQFTDTVVLDGLKLGFDIKKVTVLPSVSAFIGSDIVAGIYALNLQNTKGKFLLADLGTNGELVFSDNGKLYCTSTAAGPALEGACIECGTGGIKGAIDRVFIENEKTGFTTVGNSEPTGICGAGLTDAVALMLKENLLDESGYLEKEFVITENVYISQKDIRQFQLAKSAVFSGIEILCNSAGTNVKNLDSIMVAGGLGYYINPESAVISGLLPQTDSIEAVGNTSLKGALMCIGNPNALCEMSAIPGQCTLVDLGGNPDFSDKFMNNMYFRKEEIQK